MPRKHAHYFRSVAHLSEIDIYRLLDLFGVTDQALGHAIKKLVAPGGRGAGKDFRKDVQEAIDTLQRRLEMLDEDATASTGKVCQITPWPPTTSDAVVTTPPPDYDPASVAFAATEAGPGGWIEWSGGECPVPPGTFVWVRNSNGDEFYTDKPERIIWGARMSNPTIIAYRGVPT